MAKKTCIVILGIIIIFGSCVCFIQLNHSDNRINTLQDRNEEEQIVWETCSLPQNEWPSYDYFTNSYEGHYNLSLENAAAFVVQDYALKQNMPEKEWKLVRIIYRDRNYHVFVEANDENEIYFLLNINSDIMPCYSIMADIRRNGEAGIKLQEETYSYDSMLEWSSYRNRMEQNLDFDNYIDMENETELFDSIYIMNSYQAMYDYLEKNNEEKSGKWRVNYCDIYIGTNGYIADISYTNGTEIISVIIDIWNKLYAILN